MAENETALKAAGEATTVAPETTEATEATETHTAAQTDTEAQPTAQEEPTPVEEISYHAVEKDGQVTAIWEMQGRKHLRTIDPRSRQGQEILRLYTAEHHE
ncbi:MAG: hypothetical protein NVSMB56_08710 [Pyrinomonadaceae bacterium]